VSDVESARLLSDQEFTPYVRVSGKYALVASYGGGGGEFVVRRVAKGWQLVAGGGGPASAEILAQRGCRTRQSAHSAYTQHTAHRAEACPWRMKKNRSNRPVSFSY